MPLLVSGVEHRIIQDEYLLCNVHVSSSEVLVASLGNVFTLPLVFFLSTLYCPGVFFIPEEGSVGFSWCCCLWRVQALVTYPSVWVYLNPKTLSVKILIKYFMWNWVCRMALHSICRWHPVACKVHWVRSCMVLCLALHPLASVCLLSLSREQAADTEGQDSSLEDLS